MAVVLAVAMAELLVVAEVAVAVVLAVAMAKLLVVVAVVVAEVLALAVAIAIAVALLLAQVLPQSSCSPFVDLSKALLMLFLLYFSGNGFDR